MLKSSSTVFKISFHAHFHQGGSSTALFEEGRDRGDTDETICVMTCESVKALSETRVGVRITQDGIPSPTLKTGLHNLYSCW